MQLLRLFPLLLLVMAGSATAETAHVAVATNFSSTLELLTKSFEKATGHRVSISAASTGKLYAQIRHGAPYDLFLAADQARPKRLEQEGLAAADSRFVYALGRLVLWAPDQEFEGAANVLLAKEDIRRIAIANPKTAPYGLAAQQTLEAIGLWERLEDRLVRGENIGQAFQFVASGAAEMGFVAQAQLQQTSSPQGYRWLVQQELYQPIRQEAVLLKRGIANPAANAFHTYLRSEEARQLIARQGYGLEGS